MKKEHIKNKIKTWLKDPYNLTFFIILLVFIAIKLYYFSITARQPLWWDEADYMNMARTWTGSSVAWPASPVRPVLLPFIASIFMFLGLGELSIRFLVMLSSIASIILMYGIGKLLFNKKIALISSFILAIFWSTSFYSYRLLTDVPVMMLWLATIYFFFNAYFKDKNYKHYILPGILLGLSFLMKTSSVILVLVIAFYLFTTEKFKVFKNKRIWIFFIIALLTITPYLIYMKTSFNSVAATPGNPYFNDINDNFKSLMRQLPFIFTHLKLVFLILFALGLLWMFFHMYLSKRIFTKATRSNNYYFLLIWIVFSLIFFSKLLSYDTSYLDERYYFVFYPAIFFIVAIGLDRLHEFIKKYQKQIAALVVLAILLFSSYQHIKQADSVIKTKKDSFIQLKLAGEYVKANTAPDDIIFILEEQAEITYYSERNFIHIDTENSTSITPLLETHKPKYVVMSFYYSLGNEFSHDIINYVFSNSDIFIPVQAYQPYVDQNQQIPLAIIFKINPLFYKI